MSPHHLFPLMEEIGGAGSRLNPQIFYTTPFRCVLQGFKDPYPFTLACWAEQICNKNSSENSTIAQVLALIHPFLAIAPEFSSVLPR
jgi:hypothetical protein